MYAEARAVCIRAFVLPSQPKALPVGGSGGSAVGAEGAAHGGVSAAQLRGGRAVPGGLAGRPGLRAAVQPHGGRGHRRDLPHAGTPLWQLYESGGVCVEHFTSLSSPLLINVVRYLFITTSRCFRDIMLSVMAAFGSGSIKGMPERQGACEEGRMLDQDWEAWNGQLGPPILRPAS